MNSEILLQKGRIVYINFGPHAQQYAVLADFVNTKKVIIDSPAGSLPRQVISAKRVEPTKFLLSEFDNSQTITTYATRFAQALEKLSENGRGKTLKQQALRKNLNDFDRFKVMVLRRKLAKAVRTSLNK